MLKRHLFQGVKLGIKYHNFFSFYYIGSVKLFGYTGIEVYVLVGKINYFSFVYRKNTALERAVFLMNMII